MSSSRTRVPAASGPTTFEHPTPGWTYPGTAPGPAEARHDAASPPAAPVTQPAALELGPDGVPYIRKPDGRRNGLVETTTGPGGGIEFAPDVAAAIADLGGGDTSFTQAGLGAVVRSLQGKAREWVSPEDFGAVGDGVADDSVAVQEAASASGFVRLSRGKTYRLESPVEVTSSLTIAGCGATVMVGENAAFSPTAPLVIRDVRFVSTSTGSSSGFVINKASNNLSGTVIDSCVIGRLKISITDGDLIDTIPVITDIAVTRCLFIGDYTGIPGGDVNNVISIRGGTDVRVENNVFRVVGVERFVKISGACRRVYIRGNSFVCLSTSVGKQAIDLFADTREVIVSDNIVDIVGFSAFVENKNGDNSSATSEPSEVVVQSNTIKMSGANANMSAIAVYGAWGLAENTLPRSTAKVSNNTILQTDTGATSGAIVLRGLTHADISGNTLHRNDEPNFAVAVEASNCKLSLVSGNVIEYGAIYIGSSRGHPNSTTYANPPQKVSVFGNQVSKFSLLNGVHIGGAGTIQHVLISGNGLFPKEGGGSSGVIQISATTVAFLSITANLGESVNNSAIVLASGGVVDKMHMDGNSWQTRSVTATPGTVAAGGSYSINITVKGAKPGDVVEIGMPYSTQGAVIESRVSVTNNVLLQIHNKTGSSLTFDQGVFTARTSRI